MLPLIQCLIVFEYDADMIIVIAAILRHYPSMDRVSECKLMNYGIIRVFVKLLHYHYKQTLPQSLSQSLTTTGQSTTVSTLSDEAIGPCMDTCIDTRIMLIRVLILAMKTWIDQPCTSSLPHIFLDSGICPILAAILLEYRDSDVIVKKVSLLVWSLCISVISPKFKEEFLKTGICITYKEIIISAYQYQPVVYTAICGAIGALARSVAIKTYFGTNSSTSTSTTPSTLTSNTIEDSMCALLINSLYVHQQQPGVIMQICWAIGNMTTVPHNHQQFVSGNVADALCHVLALHMDKIDVAEHICFAMWALAQYDHECKETSPSSCYQASKLTTTDIACEPLVTALLQHPTIPPVVFQVCGTLYHICKGNLINQHRVIMLDVRRILFQALHTFGILSDTSKVIREILTLDVLLLANIDTFGLIIPSEKIPLLLQILHIHCSKDNNLIEIICLIFVTLLSNDSTIALFDNTAITMMISLLTTHKMIESTVISVLAVLQKTGIQFNYNTSYHNLLVLLLEIVSMYKQCNITIIHPICDLIVSLGMPTINQIELTSMPFCSLFIELFKLHLYASDTICHICSVLVNASSQKFIVAKCLVCDHHLLQCIMDATKVHIGKETVIIAMGQVLHGLTSFNRLVQNGLDIVILYQWLERVLPMYCCEIKVMQVSIGMLTNLLRVGVHSRVVVSFATSSTSTSVVSASSTTSSSSATTSQQQVRLDKYQLKIQTILSDSIQYFTSLLPPNSLGSGMVTVTIISSENKHYTTDEIQKLINDLQVASRMLSAAISTAATPSLL